MKIVEGFFSELDNSWKLPVREKIHLRVIGSAALLLQTKYSRGTKDSDILETADITPEINKELTVLAGKGSRLAAKYRMYLDIVAGGFPFLPAKPLFHPVPVMGKLKCFSVSALDVTDVVVSKIKRFSSSDVNDIRTMYDMGLLDHKKLVGRFVLAVDAYSMDARAEELPAYVKHLHSVERDFFEVAESFVELPDWI